MKIDRSATARALAKAIAYAECGKPELANEWARELVMLLAASAILSLEARRAPRLVDAR